MAGVEPFKALHYDLAKVGVARRRRRPALRRDRRRDAARSWRRARPTTSSRSTCRATPDGGDPYEHAAELLDEWKADGALVGDDEPAIWALSQDYTAPDGSTTTRRGFLARVRVADYGEGVRPHERTQPGPEGGPAAADAGDEAQPLADLLAAPRGRLAAHRARARRRAWGEVDRRRRHRPPRLARRRPGRTRGDRGRARRRPSC